MGEWCQLKTRSLRASLSCFHSSSYIVSTGSRFQRRSSPFASRSFGASTTELSQFKPRFHPWQPERRGATYTLGGWVPSAAFHPERQRTHGAGKATPGALTLEKSGLLNLWNVLGLPAWARSSETWQEWEKGWVNLWLTLLQ